MIVIMRDAVMPECCNTCVCSEGYGCGITGILMKTKEMESRPDWCPLEEIEPCEDAASRKNVVKFLDDWMSSLDANCHHQSMADLKIIKNDFENLPSVTPKRKTGKWNFIGNQMFECSECGTCYTQSQFYQMRVRISDTEFPKFCPNCGADMRGERDETD